MSAAAEPADRPQPHPAQSSTEREASKQAFKARERHWAAKLDIQFVWLGVRPMHNKWASCSTNGHLNFSTDLLPLEERLWDYVIVHELLHFDVPNHGKLWKSLMRAHVGDWERCEELLREHASRGHESRGTA